MNLPPSHASPGMKPLEEVRGMFSLPATVTVACHPVRAPGAAFSLASPGLPGS